LKLQVRTSFIIVIIFSGKGFQKLEKQSTH
jgi:hypothetical protein